MSDQCTSGTERVAVAKCPNCGYVYGDDLDYRFPNPSECLECGAETENTTVADPETVRSLADDGLRADGGTVEDSPDRPQWVCSGCGKAVSTINRPPDDCQDCGGSFLEATPGRLECEICRDPDASRVFNSEHNRLCDHCIELENAGLGHVEILRIKECTRCGKGDQNEEYSVKGIARIGGNLCTDCLLEMGDKTSTGTDHERSD